MSERSFATAGDDGGLAALLVLLDRAADSFRTVQVTYRTWRHEQRLREAFRSHHVEWRRRGGAGNTVWAATTRGGDPGPSETEETVRIWREGQRVRQEHYGGWRDGSYSVVDGPRWWSWSEQMGAMSNLGDPSVGGGIDRGFELMLDPASLLGLLDLRVAGNSRVASRATVTAHAAPRQEGLSDVRALSDQRAFRTLHALGIGADSHRLEVDRERGVLLATTAFRGEQPFYKITTLAIRFDEPIPAETFQFRPPEGEQTRSLQELFPRPQFVTLADAQRLAAFTVLVPDQLPTGWRQVPRCGYAEASSQLPAFVGVSYRRDAGHQHLSISQTAEAAAVQHYGNMPDAEGWHEALRDGTPIKIWPGDELLPARAQLTRHGTFVRLSSRGLTADELATVAASLRPAPHTDDTRYP
jgi:hypothetical protein